MKNYYEILEVDKNASQEVIEKAYRTLVKKYHPDLQQGDRKEEYSEKIKEVNHAYDILSDELQRAEYDEKLKNDSFSQEEYDRTVQENYELKQQINRMEQQQAYRQQAYRQQTEKQQNVYTDEGSVMNMGRVLQEQINAARKKAYYDAYIEDMRNRGYKIRYKHSIKDYFKAAISIVITILICFLIYQVPPVKQYFQNLYAENIIFQAIIDIFKNTFSVGF